MDIREYKPLADGTGSLSQPNSLASSVLQNVFGRNGVLEVGKLPELAAISNGKSVSESQALSERSEPSENVLLGQGSSPSDLVRNVLRRLDERKERAAVELGIGANEVESLPFDLSKLESEGIFMNIDCRGFGTLVRQLEWKTLGVRLPDNAAVRVSPPRAGLLPDLYRNKLMRGAAQAHNALTKYGFRFTLCETVWGTSEYKWIPWTAFEQFEQAYFQACETLSAAKAEVLAKYEEILAVLQDSFYELAEDSADRFQATTDEPLDRAEFVNAVAAQAIGMVPTRQMIRDGLVITMKPKVMILGSEMVAERNLTRTLSLEIAKVDAERTTLELEVDARRRIEQMKVDEAAENTRQEREVKERIRNMKIETARRDADEAVSPVKEGFAQITAKLFEAANEMAERMKDAKFVSGSLAKRARQMCEWYQLMNFTGDTSLEDVLGKLENAAGREVKQRSPEELRAALGELLRRTSMQSKKLLDEDRLSSLEF
ncbi:MAG: hypothetical protein H0V76_00165 [Blastocatellia bacterium]|nr:hypothetical protein [Blastocatellia bacterium]